MILKKIILTINLDNYGHIIHIDFGFMLITSPGGNMGFEQAPFKFTLEYGELIGGRNSDLWGYFKNLMVRGFIEIRKHINPIVNLIKILMENSDLPCF